MLTWLSPLALAGLALLAIPILVHLFKPRKVRITPFSSLRWLRQTQHKLSRRVQLHQILLFLLRAAFIALLVLALARPLFSSSRSGAAAERFVVLDISRSMGYQPLGRPSPIELGKQIAAKIVGQGVGDDRTAVLLVSSTAQALGPLVRDPEIYIPRLRGALLTDADTRLGSALPVIRAMLAQRRPNTDVEISFVTDNHQNSWLESDIREFREGLNGKVRVHLVDVGVPNAANGWIADARLVEPREGGARTVRVQLGGSGAGTQARTLRLTGLAGLPEQARPVTVQPDKITRVDFDLPAQYDVNSKVARLVLEPEDALASDDQYLLNLDTRGGLRVLLIEGDVTQIEPLRPAFHLSAALGALSVSQANSIDLVRRVPADVKLEDVAGAAVIVLADVPELDETMLRAVQDRVRDGAGLAIFLGPSVRPEFYNNRLFNPLAPAEGLLPVTLKSILTPSQSGQLATLTGMRWNHSLLSGLYDPVLGDLSSARFKSFYQLEQPEGVPADVLAAFDPSNAPAIMLRPFGAGNVVLFNTTANDQWGDLPRRKSFVPLVDRLLAGLGGGGLRRSFAAGEVVTLSLPALQKDETVEVVAPDGSVIKPETRTTGGRSLLRLGALQQAGVYVVRRAGQPDVTLVVQASRGDSLLNSTDLAVLKQWWEPAEFTATVASELTQRDGPSRRWNLVPGLILLAALALLAEMYFVHRLCPKMNPRAATPRTQPGFFTSSSRAAREVVEAGR